MRNPLAEPRFREAGPEPVKLQRLVEMNDGLVLLAQKVSLRHPHVVQEDLSVEVVSQHADHWLNCHAWKLLVQHEDANSVPARGLGINIGPAEEESIIGYVCQRAPYFLAVHQEAVVLLNSSCPQGQQV